MSLDLTLVPCQTTPVVRHPSSQPTYPLHLQHPKVRRKSFTFMRNWVFKV
jgi:hypothetical protein